MKGVLPVKYFRPNQSSFCVSWFLLLKILRLSQRWGESGHPQIPVILPDLKQRCLSKKNNGLWFLCSTEINAFWPKCVWMDILNMVWLKNVGNVLVKFATSCYYSVYKSTVNEILYGGNCVRYVLWLSWIVLVKIIMADSIWGWKFCFLQYGLIASPSLLK